MKAWPLLRRVLSAATVLALLVAAAVDATRLVRQWRYNQALDHAAADTTPLTDTDGVPASTLFVRAHAAAAAGRTQDALALYQAAGRDAGYAVAAQYNLGNLHLRDALALKLRDELQHNPQPTELAKRHYRAALRADPSHWPSKYNLERALHLAPELPDDTTAAPGHTADRAVTSLRGFTLGLP
jgi:mxaK protein